MYGVVVFYYRWNKKLLQGQILYKVAGQKCGGICSSGVFELPLWYPEEAQKVRSLVQFVLENTGIVGELWYGACEKSVCEWD